jgi:hypothetical protein
VGHLLGVAFVASGPQLAQNVADITALLDRWRPRLLDLAPVAALLETEFRGSGGSKGKAVAKAAPGRGSGLSSGPSGPSGGEASGTVSWMKRRLGLQLVAALLAAAYPCLADACPSAQRICAGLADGCAFGRKEVPHP